MGRRASFTKERLLDYLRNASIENGGSVKASTKDISSVIGGCTVTVSKYVNQLVAEGSLTVRRGRPPCYTVNKEPVKPPEKLPEPKSLTELLTEVSPLVKELVSIASLLEENKELKAFKDSLEAVYDDGNLVFYKQAK